MNSFRSAPYTFGLLIGLAWLQSLLAAQNAPTTSAEKNAPCGGLHAGIHWQNGLNVGFLLLNDSDEALDVSAASWKLVIDGKELGAPEFPKSPTGPIPRDGWKTLNPGQSYDFGEQLSSQANLLATGVHKLSWKGAGFQSPTITVTTPLAVENVPTTGVEQNVACRGLHAGIHWEGGLNFTFVLLNDSDGTLDVSKPSWKLVIDGKELGQQEGIFRDGPVSADDRGTRNPGQSYELGMQLLTDKPLLATGVHKLSWKGAGFQSPTITVTIP